MAAQLPPWDPADIQGAVQGDPRSWDRLARTWGPVVLRWCSFMGGAKVDPEDAAQQVFVVVWRRLDSLREPKRFPSWLFGITRRVLADQRRSAWARRWLPGARLERTDNALSPERRVAQTELAVRVGQALEELSSKHREVLILCDLQDHTVAEAAEMLDIRLNTAKSRLIRARVRFAHAARLMGLDASSDDDRVELGIEAEAATATATERRS